MLHLFISFFFFAFGPRFFVYSFVYLTEISFTFPIEILITGALRHLSRCVLSNSISSHYTYSKRAFNTYFPLLMRLGSLYTDMLTRTLHCLFSSVSTGCCVYLCMLVYCLNCYPWLTNITKTLISASSHKPVSNRLLVPCKPAVWTSDHTSIPLFNGGPWFDRMGLVSQYYTERKGSYLSPRLKKKRFNIPI